jgi:hypothetical protein
VGLRSDAAHEAPAAAREVTARDLRGDHALLRELLCRFENMDDCYARRDLIELAVDLFEVHSALESGVRQQFERLLCEYEALRELMEQVEHTDVRSQLNYARGVALCRAFDSYLSREEESIPRSAVLCPRRDAGSLALLHERERLIDYAERLLRPH